MFENSRADQRHLNISVGTVHNQNTVFVQAYVHHYFSRVYSTTSMQGRAKKGTSTAVRQSGWPKMLGG